MEAALALCLVASTLCVQPDKSTTLRRRLWILLEHGKTVEQVSKGN